MANRCHFSHQKQDKKRGYLKNHLPKAYQLLLGIRGSNQTRHIKCRSRENYQSRYHVGQTRNWNSVFQSAGCNPIAANRSSIKTKTNRNKKAVTKKDWRLNSSTGVLRAEIKQWSTDQIKQGRGNNQSKTIRKTTIQIWGLGARGRGQLPSGGPSRPALPGGRRRAACQPRGLSLSVSCAASSSGARVVALFRRPSRGWARSLLCSRWRYSLSFCWFIHICFFSTSAFFGQ